MGSRHAAVKAVYDFAADLTTAKEIIAGAAHDTAPMAERVRAFLKARGLATVVPYSKSLGASEEQK